MKKIFICWFICSISLYAQSLIDSTNRDFLDSRPIDYIIEDQIQSLSGQQFLEDLNDRIEQPIDLNTASKEELISIPGIDPLTADMILKRKTEAGTLRTMSQIDDIQDLDPRLLPYLHTFTGFGSPEHQPSVLLRSRCLYDFQKSRGYTTGIYEGSRPALMNRLTWKVNDYVEASFLTEKDAGESSLTDFTSGYILLKKVGFITSAVAGDFIIESGNGAAFGYSSSFGKGSDVILPLLRTTRGVVPYRSTGETHFFRGGGVNFKASSVDGYFFLSRKTIDATLNDSGAISSLYDLGYYRTDAEKAKYAAARESIIGARLGWTFLQNASIGCLWYSAHLDPSLLPNDPFKPSGSNYTSFALDYNAEFPLETNRESLYLSGEWMRDRSGTIGGTTGIVLRLPSLQCAVGYRLYPERFISLFGSSFGEHGETMQNERGVYIGFRTDILSNMRFSTYWDFYEFPWRTYQNPLATNGRDVLVELEADLSKSTQVRIRYRVDTRQEINEQKRQTPRADVEIEPWPGFVFHTRIELTRVNDSSSESGLLLYQNVRVNIRPKFRVEGRIVYYETDSYQFALYEYEGDVSGAFTAPALFGKGFRWYVLASYTVGNVCKFSVKYSELRKSGVKSLGSGYDTIEGGLDNSLHMQLDISF
ncbi:MAG: helix-hairpin-helix domain-containing protein [Bacteroidota bacterium]